MKAKLKSLKDILIDTNKQIKIDGQNIKFYDGTALNINFINNNQSEYINVTEISTLPGYEYVTSEVYTPITLSICDISCHLLKKEWIIFGEELERLERVYEKFDELVKDF